MQLSHRIKARVEDLDVCNSGRMTERDAFLTSIGKAYPSHRFLTNNTQAIYLRYVEELHRALTDRHQRRACDISVLDWGCGKGQITYLLSKRGFTVTSCDVQCDDTDSTFGQETPILEELKIPVVPLRHENQLPFDDSSFDCVVSFGVLEHVPNDAASLKEIRRVLKPGGTLFVTFLPYFLSWTQALGRLRGETYHDRLYSQSGLRKLATDAQFEVALVRFAQLFPKNSVPLRWAGVLEPLDCALCAYSPFKYFATNLEAVLIAA
jgi:SAM-dependent methyltransferase